MNEKVGPKSRDVHSDEENDKSSQKLLSSQCLVQKAAVIPDFCVLFHAKRPEIGGWATATLYRTAMQLHEFLVTAGHQILAWITYSQSGYTPCMQHYTPASQIAEPGEYQSLPDAWIYRLFRVLTRCIVCVVKGCCFTQPYKATLLEVEPEKSPWLNNFKYGIQTFE